MKVAVKRKMHPSVMHQLWEVIIKIEKSLLISLLKRER